MQLYEAGKVLLAVAEGIETALSFHMLTDMPIWAALSAGNMEAVVLPPLPLAQKLVIAIDNDQNEVSLKFARRLERRARQEGRDVYIVRPPLDFNDFNDVHKAYAGKEVDVRNLVKSENGKDAVFLIDLQTQKSVPDRHVKVQESKSPQEQKEPKGKSEVFPVSLKRRAQESKQRQSSSSYLVLPNKTGSEVDLAKHLLSQELQGKYGEVIYDEGGFWKYGTTHWEEISQEDLAHILHDYDGKKWIKGFTDKGEPIVKTIAIGENTVKNTLKRLRTEGIALSPHQDEWFNNANVSVTGINCLNGFIRIDETGNITLEEHHREHRQRFTIPFEFKPERLKSILNDDCPLWRNSLLRKLLYGCFQGEADILEKLKLIMEIAGATASNCTLKFKQPKVIIFYGESAENGKSQLCFLLESFLDAKDVCSVDPEHFKDEKQRLSLRNKKLNLVFELSGNALNSNYTKLIVTGDTIDARELYKMPINYKCKAQHVWASNHLPVFLGGMDRGHQRRFLPLAFNRVIPKEERVVDIGRKAAKEEGELLLAFAVCGASQAMARKDFIIPASSHDLMEQWKAECDPVIDFIQEYVRVSKDSFFTPNHDIYKHFAEYAQQAGIRKDLTPQRRKFIIRFKNNLPEGIFWKKIDGVRGFGGLELLPLPDLA